MSRMQRTAAMSSAVVAAMFAMACGSKSHPAPRTASRSTTTTTVVTPAPAPTPAPAAIGGGPRDDVSVDGPKRLDPARIDRMVSAKMDRLRDDCYAPTQGVTSFVLDLTVAPSGGVEDVTVASVNGDSDVAECVRGRILQMRFPPSAEGGVHTMTFLFGR